MKYNILLWDVDDTLLDFGYSERYAVRKCFELIGHEISDEWVERYSVINQTYWKRLEKGEVTKPQLLRGRFADLFKEMHIDISENELAVFQADYQTALGEVYCYRDSSYELCKKLSLNCRQFLITNGVESSQRSKLKLSGLDAFMEDIFISEVIGHVKPKKEFFDICLSKIPDCDKEKIILIGDSLTSDIMGAINAGIASCWYNPDKKVTSEIIPDYEINNLWDIINIIE